MNANTTMKPALTLLTALLLAPFEQSQPSEYPAPSSTLPTRQPGK